MAGKKLLLKYDEIQRMLISLKTKVADIIKNNASDEEKKSGLCAITKNANDLILDAKKIYYDAKSTKNESDFELTKYLLIKCVQFTNEIYSNMVSIVEKDEPFMAFRYDGVMRVNDNYIAQLKNEKIETNVKFY